MCVPVGGSRRLWGCRVEPFVRCFSLLVFDWFFVISLLILGPVAFLLPSALLCAVFAIPDSIASLRAPALFNLARYIYSMVVDHTSPAAASGLPLGGGGGTHVIKTL